MTRDLGREAEWRGHVVRQASSGESVRAFCAARGLAESSFHYWKRELKRRDGESSVRGASDRPSCGRKDSAGLFAELALGGMPALAAAPLEVVLGNDRRVRVRPGFDGETLRRVVAVLEALPC